MTTAFIISPACNQRIFRTTLTASIAVLRTGLFATETAIILAGQPWIAAGQHYLQLTRGLACALPADACWPTVSGRSTRMKHSGRDSLYVSIGWILAS